MSGQGVTFIKGHGGYYAVADGVRLGFIASSWRKVYGGDCWTIPSATPGGRDEFYTTRREAAAALVARHQVAAAPEPEPVLRKVWLPVNQAWMVTWHGQRIAGPITEAEADRLMAASQGPEGATS